MRGKGCVIHFSCPPYGITPAYAGKRARLACFALPHGDHPRVCGEKLDKLPFSARQLGSPPRMRGKVAGLLKGRAEHGITPAYAGKR